MRLVKNYDNLPSGNYACLTYSRNLSQRRAKAIETAPVKGTLLVASLYTGTCTAVPVSYAKEQNLAFAATVYVP